MTKVLNRLEYSKNMIALEQVAAINATSPAIKKFTTMADDAAEFIKNKFNALAIYFKDTPEKDYQHYLTFADEAKYPEVRRIRMNVPEGFKGNMLDYVKTMENVCNNFYTDFTENFIKPFDIYIAKLITTPTLLDTSTYKHNVKTSDVENFKKQLAKFITVKKYGVLPLGDIYQRNNDIKSTYQHLVNIATISKKQDLRNVRKAVVELNERINTLADMISDEKNNINVAPKTLTTLSELVFDLAKHVEFYAVVDSMIASLLHASKVNADTFKSYLSNNEVPTLEAISVQYSLEELVDYFTVVEEIA